jgi:hypothetical protein
MADNVVVTAGAGTTVAADEVVDGTLGTVKVQFVKIMDGTLDGTTKAAVGATGLAVNMPGGAATPAKAEDVAYAESDTGIANMYVRRAVPATTSGSDGDYEMAQGHQGAVWTISPFATVSNDITRPADTTGYAINDNLSDSTTSPTSGGFTLTGVVRKSGGSGIITDMLIMSSNPSGGLQGEIWLFDSAVTNINDNAAFAISDAEIKTVVAKIPFVTSADVNNSIAHVQNLNIGFTTVGSANLRYLVKVKAAYTPIASEVITVRAKVMGVD